MTDQLKNYRVFWALKVLKKEYPHFYDPEVLINSFDDAPDANPLAKAALNELFEFRRSCPKSKGDALVSDPEFISEVKRCFENGMLFYETVRHLDVSRNMLYQLRRNNPDVERTYRLARRRRKQNLKMKSKRRRLDAQTKTNTRQQTRS